MMKTINDIIDAFEDRGVNLKIKVLEDELVLIQGNKASLEFMGNLLLSIASSSSENSVQFLPKGAGKHFLDKNSELGFYLNKED